MVNEACGTTLQESDKEHTLNATRSIPVLVLLALAGALAAVAPAAPPSQASLTIRHETRGCHSWSLNGNPSAVSQMVTIRLGGSITVTNDDVMPHKLIETRGVSVIYTRIVGGGFSRLKAYPPAMLVRMGAASKITFAKVGVYRFTTKPGNSLMSNIQTIGSDNVLLLTVQVSR
jgi:hypothetical protein